MPEINRHSSSGRGTAGTSNFIPATKDFSGLLPQDLKFRTPLYHPGFPFVILWSEKAACTTVVKWFFLQTGLIEEALKYHPWVHQYEGSIFKKRPGYLDDIYDALKRGTSVVKFVRDPFARAYSSYLSVCGAQSVENGRKWAVTARRKILKDMVGRRTVVEYAFSFRQYLLWLAGQSAHAPNPHIRQQHLPRDDYFGIRFCKIESLTENFRALEQEYGLPHSVTDRPELLESSHFHKKSNFPPAVVRALLDLSVPPRRSPEFPYVNFNRDIAKGTEYENLIVKCFRPDLTLYDYLADEPSSLCDLPDSVNQTPKAPIRESMMPSTISLNAKFGETLHVLVLGQSNVANHGKPRLKSSFGRSFHHNEMRPLADPIPGGSGAGGSVWTRFASMVSDTKLAPDLVISLRAIRGTSVKDWSSSGKCYENLVRELPALKTCQVPVTHIVFHQGERDGILGTDVDTYVGAFKRLHAAVSEVFPAAQWIICRTSYRRGRTNETIRNAQEQIIASCANCWRGPDTDQLGADYRHDGTHLNYQGLKAFATALVSTFAELAGHGRRSTAQ